MVEIKVDPYKSVVILDADGEELTISDKLKIQMMPKEKECEEIWPAVVISEGSLKLIEEDESGDDGEDSKDE